MWQARPYPEALLIKPTGEREMNTNLNAAVATEHQYQLIAAAADARRSRTDRKVMATRVRSHRVSAFLKDLAVAAL